MEEEVEVVETHPEPNEISLEHRAQNITHDNDGTKSLLMALFTFILKKSYKVK